MGWIKINTDGARNPSIGLASCGMSDGMPTQNGVSGSRMLGVSRVETDNREAYDLLVDANLKAVGSSLVPHLTTMVNREWMVKFSFVNALMEKVLLWPISWLMYFGAYRLSIDDSRNLLLQ
ncbi:hypothetical protein V6N12_051622 [Hibiscus sabdariffa]|uniref:RNase H type-1 domain-containing protein n=1 Tax=Hibiscus sabdariffa TaxID=183260 RepID=A0ABR2GFW0_9ROSI